MEPITIFLIVLLSAVLLIMGICFSCIMKLRYDLDNMKRKLEEGHRASMFRIDEIGRRDYVGKYSIKFKYFNDESN